MEDDNKDAEVVFVGSLIPDGEPTFSDLSSERILIIIKKED